MLLNFTAMTGCAEQTVDFDFQNIKCDDNICRVYGTITEDLTITSDKVWLLRGTVFIGTTDNPITLTIEPGSLIKADSSMHSVLVVPVRSKIIAIGSRNQPIVFTSDKPAGERKPGDWGGIVINGLASQNYCMLENPLPLTCSAFGEGLTMGYGGNDNHDNSGVLRYVRIEFAGQYINPFADLNGLTLYAVGDQTEIDYLQIHKSGDDGVELFGGTVNLKHIFITGANDDSLDWTDGWSGKGQFIILQQYAGLSDNGIEGNNVYQREQTAPVSHPTLSNLTIIGTNSEEYSDFGMLIRSGSKGNVYSSIVTGFNLACLNIDDEITFAQAEKDPLNLSFSASILHCKTNFAINDQLDDPFIVYEDQFNIEDFFRNGQNNLTIDPEIIDPFNTQKPDFKLKLNSPAISGAIIPDDDFFEIVDYIGAYDINSDWIEGWTTNTPN